MHIWQTTGKNSRCEVHHNSTMSRVMPDRLHNLGNFMSNRFKKEHINMSKSKGTSIRTEFVVKLGMCASLFDLWGIIINQDVGRRVL